MTDGSTKVEPEAAAQKGPAKQREQPGGNDAVCFTSGLKGAAFAAGVIHAWLASDRLPPLVAAGISTGAISAAAFQRCYRELEGSAPDSLERQRWEWFRRYLDSVTNNPLSFIWRAIPDPVDFFADSVPVKDLSAQSLPFDLPREETKARRHYYVLTKLGIWLAGFPVRIGTLASIAVFWVRWKEGYGVKWLNPVAFAWNLCKALAGLWWHILRSPRFLSEWSFEKRGYRPLFGWLVWIGSVAPILAAVFLTVAATWWEPWKMAAVQLAVSLIVAAAGLLSYLVVKAAPDPGRKWSLKTVGWEMGRHLFKALDIERGLLSQFELKRGLAELFEKQTLDPALKKDGPKMHLLIVCAALQQSRQIWPAESVSVVEALSGATAVPGVFPPLCKPRSELKNYTGEADKADVVDGAAVRTNPIPAFFEWCNLDDGNRAVAQALERADQPSLHVIYNVPIDRPGSMEDAPPKESIDIVDSALASLELEKRRDTRQEVRQTNFISGLEKFRRKAVGGSRPERVSWQIFADEIAPEQEIGFRNEWEPSREESLKVAAGGCRTAMETLYRHEIEEAKCEAASSLPCMELLKRIAPGRIDYLNLGPAGLPEVCANCCGVLQHRATRKEGSPPPGAIRSYGEKGKTDLQELPKGFEHLQGDEPRIVFLGSGGVFRGAFHIGVIGAMQAARVFPDLVVGASVGALMGGALAAISVAPENREAHLLEQLASVFLAVDTRVALTRTFKNATKQLGVRARGLSIAPSELRRMVRSGSKADAGYAATGAPPALIDAIAQLFTIPHRRTTEIASEFIAGHFTNATNCFLKEVRQETLSSFEIERFLIGISLLKEQAENLLGKTVSQVRLNEVQPYHYPAMKADGRRGKKVSFFCTTSFLNARTSLLLGRDFLTEDPTWDFIFAALSSSAFPAVFSPRSEAEVLPGRGRTDRLFADGGMFDNLPFFPAIEVLDAGQTRWRQIGRGVV